MDFKQKTTDEKIELLKNYLLNENSNDLILALNIFNLIKRGNSFAKSFFEHKDIIFNSIIEFVDIKNKLNKELTDFCKKVLIIYYNCIYRCNNFEKEQETKPIPKIYEHFLYQADFFVMSQLAMEYGIDDFTKETYENGIDIIIAMAKKVSLFDNFIQYLNEDTKK